MSEPTGKPSPHASGTDGAFIVVIEDDEGKATDVPLRRAEVSIGREKGNTIRLTEWNVSRKHARLTITGGTIAIEDLGSSNGVRVNGRRIAGRTTLAVDDRIEIADYALTIRTRPSEPAAPSAPAPEPTPTARAARASEAPPGRAAARTTDAPARAKKPTAEPPVRAKKATEPPAAAALGHVDDDAGVDDLEPAPRRRLGARQLAIAAAGLIAVVVVVVLLTRGKGGSDARRGAVAARTVDAGRSAPLAIPVDAAEPAIDAAEAIVDAAEPVIDAAEPVIDAPEPVIVDAAEPAVAIDAAARAPLDAGAAAPSADQVAFERFAAAVRRRNATQALALYEQIRDGSPYNDQAEQLYAQLHTQYLRDKEAQAKTLARVGKCRELQALATEAGKVFADARDAVAAVECKPVTTGPTGSGGGSDAGSGGGSATPAGPNAAALTADAQAAARASQWSRALSLAEKALAAGPDDATRAQSIAVAALAACSLPDAARARRYAALMPTNRQGLVRQRCLANGVELP